MSSGGKKNTVAGAAAVTSDGGNSDNEGGVSSFMAPTAENMRKFELKNQRGLMGSSLITSAIQDVVHTNKVKSEFNARIADMDDETGSNSGAPGGLSAGKMMSAMNMATRMGANPLAGSLIVSFISLTSGCHNELKG